MHHPPLTSRERPRKREFVPHAVLLEHEHARVDIERRRVVQVQVGCFIQIQQRRIDQSTEQERRKGKKGEGKTYQT